MANARLAVVFLMAVLPCFMVEPVRGEPMILNLENPTAIPGEYIVMLKRGYQWASIKNAFPGVDVQIEEKLGQRRFAVIKYTGDLNRIAEHPMVDYIEANVEAKLIKPFTEYSQAEKLPVRQLRRRTQKGLYADPPCQESQPEGTTKWGITRTSYHDPPADYTNTPYQYAYDGTGVDIVIMDTGIDINHPLFKQTGTTRASYGMVARGATGGEQDKNGHGTHVSGTCAGDGYGIAPLANLISCKVLGALGAGNAAGSVEAFAWLIERVQNQINQGKKPRVVVNMSLGGSGFVQSLYDAIEEAIDYNIVVVVAAGNSGLDASEHWPASFNNTVTVGATNSTDYLTTWSNYGSTVDIAAPGSLITSAASSEVIGGTNDTLATFSGTSMACPHVAGVVAAYLQQLDDADLLFVTPHSIRDMLQTTASVGYIKFPYSNQTMTNKLLYDNCGTTPYNIRSYTTTTGQISTLGASSARVILGGWLPSIIGLLTLSRMI